MRARAWMPSAPVLVITGHYGVGKTNLTLNLAMDAAVCGLEVTVVDLDVVNPFFRSSDYQDCLETAGVRMIAPLFAGTNLDGPSLSGSIVPAIDQARATPGRLLIIDAGGDDVGATALGCFAQAVAAGPYEMLYVVNRNRNLTQDTSKAVCVLREIESKAHLKATAVANNTHLQGETDVAVVSAGIPFAQEVARLAGLPLAFTTAPQSVVDSGSLSEADDPFFTVKTYVRTPWQ